MGSNNSTSNPTKSPEEQKREQEDKAHKEYVAKVLSRNDASAELKGALIECAESKKALRDAQTANDFLKKELDGSRVQLSEVSMHVKQAQEVHRELIMSNGVVLFFMFCLFLVVFATLSSHSATHNLVSTTLGECGSAWETVQATSPPFQGSDDVLIITRSNFESIYELHRNGATSTDIYSILQKFRRPVSYYQVLRVIQSELLPEITFSLVAACLGITLLFTAVVGAIVPQWADFTAQSRFAAVSLSTTLFFVLGLFLSSLHDSIDIPGGVVLTIAVLSCPLVCFTGMEALHARAGRNTWKKYEPEWCIIVSCIVVLSFTAVLLHTIAFAPLAIVAVVALSVLVWVLLRLLSKPLLPNGWRNLAGQGMLWLASLCAWTRSSDLVALLQPSRRNATYSIVTDVAVWLDWGLMLTTFGWFLAAYIHAVYWNSVSTPWTKQMHNKNATGPPGVIYLGVWLQFAHLLACLYLMYSATGEDTVTVTAFAHLCGVFFFAEAFLLITATFALPSIFGLSAQLCACNSVLLWLAVRYDYTMFMVLSVLNIAMYILLAYGVAVAMGVAAVAIALVVLAK